MKIYCEGSHCARKSNCALHCTKSEGWSEYIDWSTQGGGHCWTDSSGHSHIETWAECGDEGNFKKFIEVE